MISFYWDGDSGFVSYDRRTKALDVKPVIGDMEYSSINYNSDMNVATKWLDNFKYELTPNEIFAIQSYANITAEEHPQTLSETVKVTPQVFTEEEKRIARENIGIFLS